MGGTAEGASRGEVLDLHGEAASAVLRQWRGAADEASLPKHIAIIPDGNRRWAKQRGMPSSFGHHKGTKRMNEVPDESTLALNCTTPNLYPLLATCV